MDDHVANGVVYYRRKDQGVAKLYVPTDAYATDATVKQLRTGAHIMDYHVANGVVHYQRKGPGVAKLYVPTDAKKLQH